MSVPAKDTAVAVLLPSEGITSLVLSPYCPLPPSARLLMLALDTVRSGRHAVPMPTQEELATDMNVNVRTVQRAMQEAEKAGWLRRARRATKDGRQPDVYELVAPKTAHDLWHANAITRAAAQRPLEVAQPEAATNCRVAEKIDSAFRGGEGGALVLELQQPEQQQILPPKLEQSAPPLVVTADAVQHVADYWREKMGHPHAIVKRGTKRWTNIERMLRHFTVAQLCKAVDGNTVSAYHHGENEGGMIHDDIELICRSVEKVEMFMRFADKPPRARRPARAAATQGDFLAGVTP